MRGQIHILTLPFVRQRAAGTFVNQPLPRAYLFVKADFATVPYYKRRLLRGAAFFKADFFPIVGDVFRIKIFSYIEHNILPLFHFVGAYIDGKDLSKVARLV